MQKILIIEDDLQLQQMLQSVLSNNAECSTARTLEIAYTQLEKKRFDLVLVDRVLPDGDGIEVISYLADSSFRTKVLALSRKASIDDRVQGLETGADDYLAKPFSLAELKLKVKKLLQTEKIVSDTSVRVGSLELFPHKGFVQIVDKSFQLRKKEAEILHCLLRYKNRVVTRAMLIQDVWSGSSEVPTDTTLDVYIRRIRVILQEYGNAILTVRGFGYKFSEQAVAHT